MILFNNIQIPILHFPNGETILDKPFFGENKKEKNIVTLKYESDADLFQLLLIRKAIWFPVDLEIPYFPYSRMDRKSDSYVFTLKSVCKFINWLDFDNIYIYEPHSDVTPALLNKCKIIDLIPELLKLTRFDVEKDYVFYPDAGAQKKYAKVVKSPNEIVGFKKRDFKTGRIEEIQILGPSFAGKKVFIIDDLCSKGSTFVLAAKRLRSLGAANVFLVVAHCENTISKGKIFETDLIDYVYTTNTIITTYHDKLTAVPYTSLI